ncbi:phage holin, lambda family [Pseudomonas plecoglossicida]|uniref:phage holin, lambda family n=1 Tax=Pseudomonas plecoglossicida TaxID=70775 RepID=UPI003D192C12
MNMPEMDPALWAAVLTWVLVHQLQLYAAGLSLMIAALRVVYGGGGCRQTILEAALCGLITLALVPLLDWLLLPQGMAAFAGGAVGLMGVEKLRGYSDLIMSRKAKG